MAERLAPSWSKYKWIEMDNDDADDGTKNSKGYPGVLNTASEYVHVTDCRQPPEYECKGVLD